MSLQKILATGIIFTSLLGSCMKTPAPGDFKKQSLVDIPSLPYATLIKGGKCHFKKITKNRKWIGIEITRNPLFSKKEKPKNILFPEQAKNPGFDISNIFETLWISYEIDNNRYLDAYSLNPSREEYELKKRYTFNTHKNKYSENR